MNALDSVLSEATWLLRETYAVELDYLER